MTRTTTIDALGLLSVIEACYDLDGEDAAWLARMADAVGALLDDGIGVMANLYGGDAVDRTRITDVAFAHGFPVERVAEFRERTGHHDPTIGSPPMSFESWFGRACGRVRAIAGLEAVAAAMPILGARDLYAVNGRDATGYGVWIGAPLRAVGRASTRADQLWTRVATHLAAAYRLRRGHRAGTAPAEARLSPDGTLHERSEAVGGEDARELRRAVVAIDRARTHERDDAERATGVWTGLVRARWSLVDEFTAGGRRYVVARRNDVAATSSTLTQREEMVLGLASLGNTNKEIAYELGLSASTVRVLLARAAARLGVKRRDEAVARWRERTPG